MAYRMRSKDKEAIMKIIKKYGYEPDNIFKRKILAIDPDPTMSSGRLKKPVKKNMGGMMMAQKKKPMTGASATGLAGMKKGGMTKKGYAKGGMMKKKGYSKGGAMPMGKDPKTGKMIPKFAMDGKGKMAKGGMMKKKGYAKGAMMKKKGYAKGAMMKKKGMARGGAARRGR
tara:strand:+ start:994 stop:1506 length:513 start_codon:yes stop_codon:yes gene_type:complete